MQDAHARTVVTTPAQFQAMVSITRAAKVIALDFETSGISWWAKAAPVGLALAIWVGGGVHSWYVPWGHDTLEPQLPFAVIEQDLRWFFENEQQIKVFHNRKFDDHMGRKLGWRLRGQCYDTMLAARLYDENRTAKLKVRAIRDLGFGWAKDAETAQDKVLTRLARRAGLGKEDYRDAYGYAQVPLQVCGPYACLDAEFTLLLRDFYENWGVSRRFPRVWTNEMALTEVLVDMEETGMPLDIPYLHWLKGAVTYDKHRLESEIAVLLTRQCAPVFELGSDEQLIAYMQRNLGLQLFHRTEKGNLSVGREALEYWSEASPVLPKILEWRDADKIDTTYTTSLLRFVDSEGVLHTNFQQAGTNTGRLSCRQPNFQNIPADGGSERSVRRMFIVRPGTVRLYEDYSQIELRVLAYFSRDPILLEAYRLGQDIHSRTSLEIFGTDAKERRRLAKVINFGLCLKGDQLTPVMVGGKVSLVRLDEVRPDHLVWDGIEWVAHDGLVCRGECEVIEYDGLTATPEHVVYTETGEKVRLGCLASEKRPRRLARGADGKTVVRYDASPDWEGEAEFAEVPGCGTCVWCLREKELGAGSFDSSGAREVLVPECREIQGCSSEDIGAAVRFYGAALREGYACVVIQLQGAWDKGVVRVARALYSLGFGDLARYGFQGTGFGSQGQCGPLRAEQYAFGLPVCEFEKQALARRRQVQAWAFAGGGQSISASSWPAGLPGVYAALPGRFLRPKTSRVLVYDILNAGPRHRFTVAGKVVSNSYGMGPQGFARNAKISEQEAKAYLDKFFERYAGIKFFRESFIAQVTRNGCQFNNPWGRPRRIPWLSSPDNRLRSRAGRQCIGGLIQGTAAELTRESLVRIWRWLRETGVRAKLVNTVHDEIQTDTEFAALAVTARAKKQLMEDFHELDPVKVIVEGEYATAHWGEKKALPPVQEAK